MHARVATFEGGDEAEMMRLTEERSSSGTMNSPEGLRSAMVLSGQGRRLFITFFDSEDDIRAAEARFEQMGDEIPEEVRGRRTAVDVYEVVWRQDT